MAFLSRKRAHSVNFVEILNTPKKLQKKTLPEAQRTQELAP